MDDLERCIEERKKRSAEFADGFEMGYEQFKIGVDNLFCPWGNRFRALAEEIYAQCSRLVSDDPLPDFPDEDRNWSPML